MCRFAAGAARLDETEQPCPDGDRVRRVALVRLEIRLAIKASV